jgi:hypothetical protein
MHYYYIQFGLFTAHYWAWLVSNKGECGKCILKKNFVLNDVPVS